MTGANKEILRYVRKARDRMHMTVVLEYTVKASTMALSVYLFLVLLSRFVPVYNVYGKGAILAVSLILSAFIISLFMTPKDTAAAMMLDSKGLKERTLTALELLDDHSSIGMLQKQDALEHLKALDIKKEIRIKFPTRWALISAIMMLSIMLTAFIPNPMDEKAVEIFNFKKEIKNQQDEIEKLIKKVETNNSLSLEQKDDAKKLLEELKKELSKVQDENEGEKALERTKNKMGMIRDKYTDKDLDKIIDTFSKNQATKSLAETLKSGDIKKFKSEIKSIAEDLKNMSQKEIEELSQSLSELAGTLAQNPELAEAFYELAQKMAEGKLGNLDAELAELDKQISQLMQNSQFKKSMDELVQVLRDSSFQKGKNKGSGQSSGQGENQGYSGSEIGSGGGAGTGQGNQDKASGGKGTGLGNKQSSKKDVKEYEKIFTPSLLGGEGEESQLKGQKNWQGQSKEYIVHNGLNIKGEMKPYNQVIGEYKEKAFKNIEGLQIPQNMENIVKNYFTSLED